jgi:transcriptional regulator with GAF, ATPase, and Fis domain
MGSNARESQLLETFVTLADTLVADYDVVDTLHVLVNNCATLLDASAAGILLADDTGELELIASTDERASLVELLQLGAAVGPCRESVVTGQSVYVSRIDSADSPWPRFREAAMREHFAATLAVPLRLRDSAVGSLNLFWSTAGDLEADDARLARALADVATVSILQERTLRESDVARQQLQRALDSRVAIEQAKGVVAQTLGVSVEEAFVRIRGYARDHGLPLAQVAARLVSRELRL